MKLLPLDRPELIELVASWLSQEDNYKWLDFGNGVHSPTPVSLKVMTQRDLHVLRVFTPNGDDAPIGAAGPARVARRRFRGVRASRPEAAEWGVGVGGLSNVDRRFKTAGSMWAVLGVKRY